MRSLQTSDLFSAIRFLNKIGMREEIKDVAIRANESKDNKSKIDMGVDLFFGVLAKASQENAEQEVYIFIANIFECEPEEVRVMKPTELFKKLEQAADFEEWQHFFKHVAALTKKK